MFWNLRGTVISSGSPDGEPEDQLRRLAWPWPQLADQLLAARADEAAEDERDDDDRIVELPGDWNEVGY